MESYDVSETDLTATGGGGGSGETNTVSNVGSGSGTELESLNKNLELILSLENKTRLLIYSRGITIASTDTITTTFGGIGLAGTEFSLILMEY